MILQALYEYYQKHKDDNPPSLPQLGLGRHEINYMIVLEEDGSFDRLQECGSDGAVAFFLPTVIRGTSNAEKNPRLLWDNPDFVLGHAKKDKNKIKAQQKAQQRNEYFLKQLNELPDELKQDAGVRAVLEFYRLGEDRKVFEDPEWKQCSKNEKCNIAFRLRTESNPIACRPAVIDYVVRKAKMESIGDEFDSHQEKNTSGKKRKNAKIRTGCCLIIGKHGPIVHTVRPTKIPGSKNPTVLVSFQQEKGGCGYDSYGKTQCYNAPISFEAEFAFTTALKYMLDKKENHFCMDNVTAVFWVERALSCCLWEDILPAFIRQNEQNREKDVQALQTLCNAVYSGEMPAEDQKKTYYFMGLSPNGGRICVRFWKRGTVGELAKNIAQHFDDLRIIKGRDYPPLYSILTAIIPDKSGKEKDPSKEKRANLSAGILKAALDGTPYPVTCLNLCLNQIRRVHRIASDDKKEKTGKAKTKKPNKKSSSIKVSACQAAILKAYLNRKNRFFNSTNSTKKEILMSYDPDNPSPAYQWGALFALFVKIQEEANPDLNRTICDSFFSMASFSPTSVFRRLVCLNRFHLDKIRRDSLSSADDKTNTNSEGHSDGQNRKRRNTSYWEKQIQTLMCRIGTLPSGRFSPDDQARFCLGYYQYRQKLFEPRTSGPVSTDTNDTNQN